MIQKLRTFFSKKKSSSFYPKSKTFCVMPWFNIASETNGKCKICCVVMTNKYLKKDNGDDFRLDQDKIESIWNSTYLKDIRKKMLKGEQVDECSYCYEQDHLEIKSPRLQFNERWYSDDLAKDILHSKDHDGGSQTLPQSLEPRPGTYCNLKCQMCWSLSSTSIEKERRDLSAGKYGEIPPSFKNDWKYELEQTDNINQKWAETKIYQDNTKKLFPYLKRLYFTGGEPTLIKANTDLLRSLLQAGKNDLLIQMTTNATKISPDLLSLLTQFKKVEITCSIDGHAKINDYIRYPSNWNNIQNNLKILRGHENFSVSIMCAIQALNIYSVIDLLSWLSQMPGKKIHFISTFIPGPNYLTTAILTDKIIHDALKYARDSLQRNLIDESYHGTIQKILTHLESLLNRDHPRQNNDKQKELRTKFRDYAFMLDKVRKTDIHALFPQFKELL